MIRIRQLVIQLLVLNILFSNFAWAVDECTYLIEGPETFLKHSIDESKDLLFNDSSDISNQTSNSCNFHCFAHIQSAVNINSLSDISYYPPSTLIVSFQTSYFSFQKQPPIRPPRV